MFDTHQETDEQIEADIIDILGDKFLTKLKTKFKINYTSSQSIFVLGQAIQADHVIEVEQILASRDLTNLNHLSPDASPDAANNFIDYIVLLSFMKHVKHPRIIYAILAAGFPAIDLGFVLHEYGSALSYATFLNIIPNIIKNSVANNGRLLLCDANSKTYNLQYKAANTKCDFKFSYVMAKPVKPYDLTLDMKKMVELTTLPQEPLTALVQDILDFNQRKFVDYRNSLLKWLVLSGSIGIAGKAFSQGVKYSILSIPKKNRTQDHYDINTTAKIIYTFAASISVILLFCIMVDFKKRYDVKKTLDQQTTEDNLPECVTNFDFTQAQKKLPSAIGERFHTVFVSKNPPSLLFWSQAFKAREMELYKKSSTQEPEKFTFKKGFLL